MEPNLTNDKQVEVDLSIWRDYGVIWTKKMPLSCAMCIVFGAWIRKIGRTSLKGFGTIRQKYDIVIFNKNLAGERRSSPGEEVDERVCGMPPDFLSQLDGLHCLILARQIQKA